MCFYHDDDEAPSVYRETVHVSRKAHKCASCSRGIPVGQQYIRIFGVWEGRADTYKVCNLCAQDMAAIVRHEHRMGCEGNDAWPYWQEVHALIARGDPEERWVSEFPGDDSCEERCLFWPYDVAPAARQADLRQIPELRLAG